MYHEVAHKEIFMAKRVKEPAPEAEIVKADDPFPSGDAPAVENPPPEPPPVQPAPVRTGPSFGQRAGRFFRFLVRLVLGGHFHFRLHRDAPE